MLIPPRTKYPPVGAGKRYRDVLPRPLSGKFNIQGGRPNTVNRGGEEATIDDWEGKLGLGAEVYEEEDEEGDSHDFPEEESW